MSASGDIRSDPRRRIAALAALGVAASLVLAPTRAAAQIRLIDEVKVGVLAHDIGFLTHHVEGGADLNLEVLFPAPDLLNIIGSPRPHIGADINTAGNTAMVFRPDLGWTLLPSLFGGAVFANGSLGGAVHDGSRVRKRRLPARPQAAGVGRAVPRERRARLPDNADGQRSAILDHISNANLAPRNAGITSAGARLGFRF